MNSIQASPDYPIKEPDRRLNLKEFSEISTSGHTGMATWEGTKVICMAKLKCYIYVRLCVNLDHFNVLTEVFFSCTLGKFDI